MTETEDHDPYESLQYRCIMFKNGDLVMAGIPEDDLDYINHAQIEIYTPILLTENLIEREDGTGFDLQYGLSPWIPLGDTDCYEIASDTIMSVFMIKPQYEEIYFRKLDQLHIASMKEILGEAENLTEEERQEIEDRIEGIVEPDWAVGIEPTKYLH